MPFPAGYLAFLLTWALVVIPILGLCIEYAPERVSVGFATVSVALLAGGIKTIHDNQRPRP